MPGLNTAWVLAEENCAPAIYHDFNEFRAAVDVLSSRYLLVNDERPPGFRVKSFADPEAAQEWAEDHVPWTDEVMPVGSGYDSEYENERRAAFMRAEQPDMGEAHLYNQPSQQIPDADGIELSPEQRAVLAEVEKGNSVFFTGPAGTGKSVLLREIIKLFEPLPNEELAITASTGIAAVNIGGGTLHSFASIGLGKLDKDKLVKSIISSKFATLRWKKVKTLIIDEISMIDGTLFDKLEYIARKVRGRPQPFGGIQLILSGDFFQLPPVPDKTHSFEGGSMFAFDAKSWNRCVPKVFLLQQVFRQRENRFVNMLNAMRTGKLTQDHIYQLMQLQRPVVYDDGLEPCELYPKKAQVENCNRTRLAAIDSPEVTYKAIDSAGYDPQGNPVPADSVERLLDRSPARDEISLKVGAQVMLVRNMVPGRLVNGSLGKVVAFHTLAEAIARHIAIAQPDSNNLYILPEHLKHLDKVPPAQYKGLQRVKGDVYHKNTPWPMVRFDNNMELLCAPLAFTAEGFLGNIEAHRLQVPLILSWALSIHKSQGQTLPRVKVDFGQIFEKGQGYVALSRATKLDTLEIANFDPSRIQAHPRVIAWQKTWTLQYRPSASTGPVSRQLSGLSSTRTGSTSASPLSSSPMPPSSEDQGQSCITPTRSRYSQPKRRRSSEGPPSSSQRDRRMDETP